MPRRFDVWRKTLRGMRHGYPKPDLSAKNRPAQNRPAQNRTALDAELFAPKVNTGSSKSEAVPKPTAAHVEYASAPTKVDVDPDSDNSISNPSLDTQRTISVLDPIPESHQELSQSESEDVKVLFSQRTTSSGSSSYTKGTSQLPPHYLENLKNKDFSVLIQDLRTRLISGGGPHIQHYLDLTYALEEKYNVLQREKDNALHQCQDELHEATDTEGG